MTEYGAPLPKDFKDNDILTAAEFNAVKNYWVTDELPETAENGDVVFVVESDPFDPNATPGLPGIGGWATITDVSGVYIKHPVYEDGGMDWVAYEWTGAGTLTTSGGLVETLLVSGGGGGFQDITGAGSVYDGIVKLPSEANPLDVTPGGAGVWDSNQSAVGKPSGIGDVISTGISHGIPKNPPPFTLGGSFASVNAKDYQGVPITWSGATVSAPYASSITGSPQTYASGYPTNNGTALVPSTTGYGDTKPTKSTPGNGQPGVVIVRVPANHALATIPGTWGDL